MDFRSMSSPFPPSGQKSSPRLWTQVDGIVAATYHGCVTLLYSMPEWDATASEDEVQRWWDDARAVVLDAMAAGLCDKHGSYIEMDVMSEKGPRVLRLLYQPLLPFIETETPQ